MAVLDTLKAPIRPGSKVKVWHVAAGTTAAVVLFVWNRRRKAASGAGTLTAAGSATPSSSLSPYGGGGPGGGGGLGSGPAPNLGSGGDQSTSTGQPTPTVGTVSNAGSAGIAVGPVQPILTPSQQASAAAIAASGPSSNTLIGRTETTPGQFTPIYAPTGVVTGAPAIAVSGSPYYNPNPGYGHSAYGTF